MFQTFPKENIYLKNQTELSQISDEEFKMAYSEPKFTVKQRILQVIMFILGLGWFRLFLYLIINILYFIIVTPCHAFCHIPILRSFFLEYSLWVSQHYIRLTLFAFGVYWIQFDGKPNPKARAYLYNHISILDGPLIFTLKPFTVITKAEIKKVPFFGQICISDGAVFIDRTKTEGSSMMIKDCMLDHSRMPISIAPEGKISNGDILFKFRTGAFHTEEPIQPIVIRFYEFLSFGGGTRNWLPDDFFPYLWLAFCSPIASVKATFLPLIESNELINKTPVERATLCQLRMANELGTLAIDRSTREIYNNKIVSNTPLIENQLIEK